MDKQILRGRETALCTPQKARVLAGPEKRLSGFTHIAIVRFESGMVPEGKDT